MQESLFKHRPHFTGHETFPLRQLWLRKAFDQVSAKINQGGNCFSNTNSVVNFGVGKNMVSAIRHWAIATDFIKESNKSYVVSDLGEFIFNEKKGKDIFFESSVTAWLIHWKLAGEGKRSTTWYWLFSYITDSIFDRELLVERFSELISERKITVSKTTLKRDIDCCLRSYAPLSTVCTPEESSEFVLAELGLLRSLGKGQYEFVRGAKEDIPDELFVYALLVFWEHYAPSSNTVKFEDVVHQYGSPGRVFKMSEGSIAERLERVEDITEGQLIWSNALGISEITRNTEKPNIAPLDILARAYA